MRPAFFANPDNQHCLQATLKMALETLLPGRTWTLDGLDALCQRQPGEGTWTHGAYLALQDLPVEAVAYDAFDYQAFALEPLTTLLAALPIGVAMQMASHYDLEHAARLARALLDDKPVRIEANGVDVQETMSLLDAGWLLIANVNLATLDGSAGVVGRSVLLYDRDDDGLIGHDPGHGGKGIAGRRIPVATFERAWSFMGEAERELLALRRRT